MNKNDNWRINKTSYKRRIISTEEKNYIKTLFNMIQDCSSRDIRKVYVSQGRRKDMPSQVTISKYIKEFTEDINLNRERDKITFNRVRKNNLIDFIGKNYKFANEK